MFLPNFFLSVFQKSFSRNPGITSENPPHGSPNHKKDKEGAEKIKSEEEIKEATEAKKFDVQGFINAVDKLDDRRGVLSDQEWRYISQVIGHRLEKGQLTKNVRELPVTKEDLLKLQEISESDVKKLYQILKKKYPGSLGIIEAWYQARAKEIETAQKVQKEIREKGIIYQVKKGDTLDSIARKYGFTFQELAKYNKIELTRKIKEGKPIWYALLKPGDEIKIPPQGWLLTYQAKIQKKEKSEELKIDVEKEEKRISEKPSGKIAEEARKGAEGTKLVRPLETPEEKEEARTIVQEIARKEKENFEGMIKNLLSANGKFNQMVQIAEDISLDQNDIAQICGLKFSTEEGLMGLFAKGDSWDKRYEKFKNLYFPETIDKNWLKKAIEEKTFSKELFDFGTDSLLASTLATISAVAIDAIITAGLPEGILLVVLAKLGEIDLGLRSGHFEAISEDNLMFLAELKRISETLKKNPQDQKALEDLKLLLNYGERDRLTKLKTAIEKRLKEKPEEGEMTDFEIARLLDPAEGKKYLGLLKEEKGEEATNLLKKELQNIGVELPRHHDQNKYNKLSEAEKKTHFACNLNRTRILEHLAQSEKFQKQFKEAFKKASTEVAGLALEGVTEPEKEILKLFNIEIKEEETKRKIEENLRKFEKIETKKEKEIDRYRKNWFVRLWTAREDIKKAIPKAIEKTQTDLKELQKKRGEERARILLFAQELSNLDWETPEKRANRLIQYGQNPFWQTVEKLYGFQTKTVLEKYLTDPKKLDSFPPSEQKIVQNLLSSGLFEKMEKFGIEGLDWKKITDFSKRDKFLKELYAEVYPALVENYVKQNKKIIELDQETANLEGQIDALKKLKKEYDAMKKLEGANKSALHLMRQHKILDTFIENLLKDKKLTQEQEKRIKEVGKILRYSENISYNLNQVDLEGIRQNGGLHPQTAEYLKSIDELQNKTADSAHELLLMIYEDINREKPLKGKEKQERETLAQEHLDLLRNREGFLQEIGRMLEKLNQDSEIINEAHDAYWYKESEKDYLKFKSDLEKGGIPENPEEWQKLKVCHEINETLKKAPHGGIPVTLDMFKIKPVEEARKFLELVQKIDLGSWEKFEESLKKIGIDLKEHRTPATTGRFGMILEEKVGDYYGRHINMLMLMLPERVDKERGVRREKPPIVDTIRKALQKTGLNVSNHEILQALSQSKFCSQAEALEKYGKTINVGVEYFPGYGPNTEFSPAGFELKFNRDIYLEDGRKLKETYSILLRDVCFNPNIPSRNLYQAVLEEIPPEKRPKEIDFVSFVPELSKTYIPVYWHYFKFPEEIPPVPKQPAQGEKEPYVSGGIGKLPGTDTGGGGGTPTE